MTDMSDDDLEIIPILDDVLVAGDLDKAVTGDINEKDLESIESFDALFEPPESYDDETDLKQDTSEEIPENYDTEGYGLEESNDGIAVVDDASAYDNLFDSADFEDESNHVGSTSYEEEVTFGSDDVDTPFDATDYILPVETGSLVSAETTEFERNDSYLDDGSFSESVVIQEDHHTADSKPAYIHQSFDQPEPENEDDSKSQIETDRYDDEKPSGSEYDAHSSFSETEPESDAYQLVETIMQDIMPELETQIRSIVLASLEKHLSASAHTPISQSDTDEDTGS